MPFFMFACGASLCVILFSQGLILFVATYAAEPLLQGHAGFVLPLLLTLFAFLLGLLIPRE